MKKMKKIGLLSCAAVTMFTLNANVNALEVSTEEELNNCVSQVSETCTLKNDLKISKKIVIDKDKKIILELNNKTLDVASVEDNYGVVVKGDLTINGEGTVNIGGYYGIGTSVSGGTVTVNGGNYNSTTGGYLFSSFGGNITLNDGIFYSSYNVINAFVEYAGTATINGGTHSVGTELIDGQYEPYVVLGNTTVNAGKFNQDVSDYMAETKEITNVNDVYYVGTKNTITLNKVENGIVKVNESAITGEPVTIVVEENTGYQLKTITVTDKDNNKIEIKDNTFTMPNSKVMITVEFEKIEYTVIEGENQKITLEEGKDITFRIDAEHELFDKLFIDNKEVDKKYYTTKSGSTIITLKSDYAKTLANGNHEIKVTFTDGGSATTSFTLVSNTENPDTSDNIMTQFIIGSISLISMIILSIYTIRK